MGTEGDAVTKRGSRSVIIQIVLFGFLTACCLVSEYQFFRGECCFYLPSLHTSTLMMRAVCSSETLVSVTYKTARCHNLDVYISSLSTLLNVTASLEKHCPVAASLTNRSSTSTFPRVHECPYVWILNNSNFTGLFPQLP